jgi:outer membrane protein assembly factor BamA
LGIFLKILSPKRTVKYACFALLIFLTACNTTKNLTDQQFLVEKNKVIDKSNSKVSKDEVENFIKQKPNRKILSLIPFNLWLYNQIDKEKLAHHKEKRDARFDRINAKRIEKRHAKNEKRKRKGKAPKEPKLKDKDKPTFRESLLDIAEEPVIYDSVVTAQTSRQMQKYLFSKGYFYSKVRDSVSFNPNTKKARVFYFLNPGNQYFIENIHYSIPDEELSYYIFNDTIGRILKSGAPFDADVMQKERQRIMDNLVNNGYFYFEPDYIYFDIDSAVGNRKVNVTIGAKKFPVFANAEKDSVSYVKHPRFYLNNIYIITETTGRDFKNASFTDTLVYNDFIFLSNKPLAYKKDVLLHQVDFFKGQVFQKSLAERAYKRLLNLGVFRSVLIQYVKNPRYNDQLDCYIVCTPLIKQGITVETEGTNTYGNLGIDGSILYQNKNLFRGAELFELKMTGAIAAQQQLTTDETNKNVQSTFNTLQFGPELRFSVPRAIFPFSLLPFKKESLPRTFINSSLNYQSRPEFNRSIATVNYGFSFRYKNSLIRHDIIPFEVYMVKATLRSDFRNKLIENGDYFLLNSFIDHITTLSKYSMTYNGQLQKGSDKKRALNYFKVNLSSSGNILRALYKATGQPQDTAGRYRILDIPFAQFVKVDFDYRLYIRIRKKNRVVYRIAAGIGKPLANLNVLPYEQSFFSGGPNGIRAWRARTLGPGSYNGENVNAKYDKIGDLMLEGNIEYRFHIFKSFYGAWYTDCGNIWLLKPDPSKPGGEFRSDKFVNEIAFGSGFGIRWDLNFFVLRLDLGVPLKDPKRDEGERWLFHPNVKKDDKPWNRTILNFGIGYPF